jgi:hypothetical protein
MADRVLFISWTNPVRGAEERAVETFNEAIGLLGRMQQEGRIESFDVALMTPNNDLGGCMLVKGTAQQIDAVRVDEEFLRNTIKAELSVEGICHIEGYVNEGVARMMGMYQEAMAGVPQHG